eukprot:gene8868-11962_t
MPPKKLHLIDPTIESIEDSPRSRTPSNGSTRRSSLLFGDAPSVAELKKQGKYGIDHVTAAIFWYYFRKSLCYSATVAFFFMFILAVALGGQTDYYLFFGGCLSIIGSLLVFASYLHIVPWRRHPSSLILQISGTSMLFSVIVTINALLVISGYRNLSVNSSGGLNLISHNDSSSKSDHCPSCKAMSFFIQLALLSRELWVLTLSLDLVTSITNPFASYKSNLRKYHMFIWTVAIASAIFLVNQPTCQGEFLVNGTCWLRIKSLSDGCFWGYFMSWILLFYVIAIGVLTYAYGKISKGLRSTYATRYACVRDTFRIVFFYFFYGGSLALVFAAISDQGNRSHGNDYHRKVEVTFEHIFAYLIACRGFFDALVWFFSHGFNDEDRVKHNSPRRNNNRYENNSISLGMSDIISFEKPFKNFKKVLFSNIFPNSKTGKEDLIDVNHVSSDDSYPQSPTNASKSDIQAFHDTHEYFLEYHDSDNNSNNNINNSSILAPASTNLKKPLLANEEPSSVIHETNITPNNVCNPIKNNHNTFSPPHQRKIKKGPKPLRSKGTLLLDPALTDVDLSPQLNFALRSELLLLVTQGIKESVERMNRRGNIVNSYSNNNVDYHQVYDKNINIDNDIRSDVENPLVRASAEQHNYYPPNNNNNRNNNSVEGVQNQAKSYDSEKYSNISNHNSFNYSFNNNNNNNNNIYRLSSSGNSFGKFSSNALKTMNSLLGIYVPGDYGIDPIVSNDGQIIPQGTDPTANLSGVKGYYNSPFSQSGTSNDQNEHNYPNIPKTNTTSNHSSLFQLNSVLGFSSMFPTPGTHEEHVAGIHQNNSTDLNQSSLSQSNYPLVQNHKVNHLEFESKRLSYFSVTNLFDIFSNKPSNTSSDPPMNNSSSGGSIPLGVPSAQAKHFIPPAEVIFKFIPASIDNGTESTFRDFRPLTFKKLRAISGVTDEHYLELIAMPAKERLAEGGSGAFFFFCGNNELIVKTVSKHEAKVLLNILDYYLKHLTTHPDSLLARFYGLHSITMYGNEFTFVVMKNVLPPNVIMNEKYDIKGSWINRNAGRKAPGKQATCRYCNEIFIEGTVEMCSEVVGFHEASITFKDNDMINKLRLLSDDAYKVINTLYSDSDALCEMGVMDYSLLVGIRNIQYDLEGMGFTNRNNNNYNNSNNNNNPSSGSLSETHYPQSLTTNNSSLSTAPYDNNSNSSNHNRHNSSSTITTNNSKEVYFNSNPTLQNDSKLMSDDRREFGYPARAVIAPSAYYFGMIDILETWSWTKKLERLFKVYVLGKSPDGISCVPPEEYKIRFQQKISRIIEHSIFVREVTGSWVGKREVTVPLPLLGRSDDN